ncbi:MAG: TolC family protein [Candidatus Brocadiales bacterium]|nr:TolC family protein [Candidatus Bathyanammoxibius amoris]
MRNPKHTFFSLVFLCFLFMPGYTTAQEEEYLESQEPPLTLRWVVEEAVDNNPDIRASLNRWEASQEAIDAARSLDDPRAGFQIRNAKSPIQVEGPGWNRYRRMGGVSQKIPFPGKLRLRGEIASQSSEMSKSNWEETITTITAMAKSAYYNLHYVHKAIDISREDKDLLKNLARTAETRYRVGKTPQRDVLAAQVELAKVINNLMVLEEEKLSMETRINTLLNRDPEAPLGRPEDYTQHKLAVTLEDTQALAIKNRPELKKYDFAVKRNKSTHKLAKKDLYFPDPEFAIHYMQSDTIADSWRSQVGMNIPWIWGKHRAKVRETKENVQAAEADYQAVQNDVLYEVKDLWVKAINAQSTAKIYSENVIPLAEQSLKAAITEYKTGKLDFLTLMDSERTLLDAELVYYRALADFEINLAELERAVGIPLTQDGF